MTRRNRQDYLTKNRRSPNWYLNFRVPQTHRHISEFRGRHVYQISTQTPDYKKACNYRDAFFTGFKLFGYGIDESTPDAQQGHFSGVEGLTLYDDTDIIK